MITFNKHIPHILAEEERAEKLEHTFEADDGVKAKAVGVRLGWPEIVLSFNSICCISEWSREDEEKRRKLEFLASQIFLLFDANVPFCGITIPNTADSLDNIHKMRYRGYLC